MNQIHLRKFLSQLLPVIVTFSVVNIPSDSSGFSLIPSMKICIQQKFGNSALISITKAKKLNSIQNNQLKICQKITTQPSGSAGSPPSIGSPCNNLGEKLDVNGKPIECIKNASGKLEWGPPMREQGGQQNPPQNSSANSGGTSKSGMPPWVLQDNSPLYGLQFGLLATMLSNQSGLGNIANPSLIEFPDKSLRLFFRSGSDMSVPIKIDNPGTHSYLSTDGGKTWTLEDGFRIKSDAIVSVRKAEGSGFEAYGFKGIDNELVKYTSSDGKNFTEASTSLVDASQCKNRRGVTVSFLGNDPQVVKTSSGYIGYVKSNSLINQPPWTKVACKLVSSDGINWSVDPTGTIELDDGGVVSNIGLYRNGAGNLQLLLHAYRETAGKAPISRFEIRTSSDEGKTWKNPIDFGIQFGDPEIDELLSLIHI